MESTSNRIHQSRRDFLTSAASGIGMLALASLFRDDGLLAAEATSADPLAPKPPHFAPKAKSCICIYLEGAPSQIDLFDPKPKLNELHGQALPESFTKNVRFAFLQKETARVLGSPRTFTQARPVRHGAVRPLPHLGTCADDIALIRSMHTEAFNHHPGQLMMNTRRADVRPAEHGLVAQLRPRQRVEGPARLRRAQRRPRHQRRRLATGRAGSCPRPTRASCSATRASRS